MSTLVLFTGAVILHAVILRIFLAMETKSVHTLVCRGLKQEFMALVGAQVKALDFEKNSCPVKGGRDLLSTQSCHFHCRQVYSAGFFVAVSLEMIPLRSHAFHATGDLDFAHRVFEF